MGTPDFAVPCLERLIDSDHKVLGVVSQPDRPQGRGYQLKPTPVKETAQKAGIPVYQPENLKDGKAFEVLSQLNPDLIVVVAYGRILPKEILQLPKYGCINVHGSLLPKLRGAGPFQWAVLNGYKTTGITTMYMAEGMDTGDIILKKETPIGENETAGELFDRLAPMGGDLLMETVSLIEKGTAPRVEQDHDQATYAPMIKKSDGKLDFTKTAQQVHDWIRGMYPWPRAFTFFQGDRIVIHESRMAEGSGKPGEIIDTDKLIVACGEGAIQLTKVQEPGKRWVTGLDFINGRRLNTGDKFTNS